MKTKSIFTTSDSYKYSHPFLLPKNIKAQYNYLSSRGGKHPSTIFLGMNYIIKEYLMRVPTIEQINRFEILAKNHGVPFDRYMWECIQKLGYYPIIIKAVPEGMLMPINTVLATFESTNSKTVGLVGFLETLFMKIWYPISIATEMYYTRKMLEKYGPPEWAQYANHAFGNRSASSEESAMIAGWAHLTQFKGTDSFGSLAFAEDYYSQPVTEAVGHSVLATEHSINSMNAMVNLTAVSSIEKAEEEFVYNLILANPNATILSVVGDTYDIYAFTNFCTAPDSRIRKLVESRPFQKLIIRPDSSDPIKVIDEMLRIMTINNQVRFTKHNTIKSQIRFMDFGILWGDGITYDTIEKILKHLTSLGYAAENIIFGQGTGIVQGTDASPLNRDTQRFAIKCSSITVRDKSLDVYGRETDGSLARGVTMQHSTKNIDVFKDPITDPGKASLKGRVTTYFNEDTQQYFIEQDNFITTKFKYRPVLETIFKNGVLLVDPTHKKICERNN